MSKLKLLLLLWLMLIGFASGYSQEIVKCIVIETNSGGFIECNLTKHPKLTQNNNVVTLTTDESVTEFSTTDFKKVYFGEDKTLYKLSYFVDGESYKIHKYEVGESITPEAEPTKEGYTFSGWSDIPATMPANDITVTGTFSVNKYKLVYKVDGEEYKGYDVEYGATITPETEPTKEGYTFSGWSDIPATMLRLMARNTRAMMWSMVQPSLLKRNRLRRDTRSLGGVTFRPLCLQRILLLQEHM